MLSLLSLIIASGTVLRADTEQWEPTTYPDPRTNATQCNTVEDSTLCDPDRILTDTWRQTIHDNIVAQTNRLQNIHIKYTENASAECHEEPSTGVRIFVILARRINTTSSQNITRNDLTAFGHGLREAFGLDAQPCKNYVLVLGVELAKEIYVWTGSDLALPKGRMETSLEQYKNLFLERNYMEGLNTIVDEIGNVLADPFKGTSTDEGVSDAASNVTLASLTEDTTAMSKENSSTPVWIYIIMIVSVSVAVVSLLMLVVLLWKWNKIHDSNSYPVKNEKPPYTSVSTFQRIASVSPIRSPKPKQATENSAERDGSDKGNNMSQTPTSNAHTRMCSVSAISLPRTASLNGSDMNAYLYAEDMSDHGETSKVTRRSSISSSTTSYEFTQPTQIKEAPLKVTVSPDDLFTDKVEIRCVSDVRLRPSQPHDHKWASF